MPVEIRITERSIPYSGRELRPHWIFEEFGIRGDAAVAWMGPCAVEIEDLVDVEDADAGGYIAADEMLHFIAEHFLHPSLLLTAHRQRLLVALAAELFCELSGAFPSRRGDDLFVNGGKLSVSIATVSPVSGLIHFGVNVTGEGTPIETACLADFGISPLPFARELLRRYAEEISSLYSAIAKVSPR